MPCFKPLAAYQHTDTRQIYFRELPNTRPLTLPCGQCIGCRLEKSRQWAIRMIHEAQLHTDNCFITLTYDDENLPPHGTLYKPHLQRFFKRLRKNVGPFRYYACGEYGEQTNRAHYHACIFGLNFNDRIPFRRTGENTLYISEQLTKTWGHGQTSIGELTFETAAYTARYVTKKTLGKGQQRYVRIDEDTGEIIPLVQPFAVMSLRSAIASQWLPRFHSDIYGHDKDFIMIRGKKMKPAKYYDKLYDIINHDHMSMIKKQRIDNAEQKTDNELRARETITRARLKLKTAI